MLEIIPKRLLSITCLRVYALCQVWSLYPEGRTAVKPICTLTLSEKGGSFLMDSVEYASTIVSGLFITHRAKFVRWSDCSFYNFFKLQQINSRANFWHFFLAKNSVDANIAHHVAFKWASKDLSDLNWEGSSWFTFISGEKNQLG